MKYPGLDPVGRFAESAGWRLAGSDLPEAVERLESADLEVGTVASGVQVCEALRRSGQVRGAQRRLSIVAQRSGTSGSRILLEFAAGTLHWTLAEGDLGVEAYTRCLRLADDAGDIAGAASARLGVLRCQRLNVRKGGLARARQLAAEIERLDDPHLLADAQREVAAWALLRDENSLAEECALAARRVHLDADDRYLAGTATLLLARARNAGGSVEEALTLVRTVVDDAASIGSDELGLTSAIYLGQFLQRGIGPDNPRWQEAVGVLTRALDTAGDSMTEAEILMPLAQLWLSAGMFPQAEAALDRYEVLYQALGGNLIAVANLDKMRARLELAKVYDLPEGGFSALRIGLPRLVKIRRLLRRAERLYRGAGAVLGARNVRAQREFLEGVPSGSVGGSLRGLSDPFATAQASLWSGERLRGQGEWRQASAAFQSAREHAIEAGSTLLAIAAATRDAEMCYQAGDSDGARKALWQVLQHAEAIRGAVTEGPARGRIATYVRSHYERVALLAAKLSDPLLALEALERLRTEQLAGLLGRRKQLRLPDGISAALAEIDRLREALASGERPGNVALVRGLDPAERLTLAEESSLLGRLASARRSLAEQTNETFAELYDAPPADVAALTTGLEADVLVTVPVVVEDREYVVSVWKGAPAGTAVRWTELDEPLAELKNRLIDGPHLGRIDLRVRDLAPLTRALPAPFVDSLNARRPRRLVVVPSGWLWGVPFGAIPVGSTAAELVVDGAEVSLAPSLRTLAILRNWGPPPTVSGAAASYAEPGMRTPDLGSLRAFPGGHVVVRTPEELRSLVVHGGEAVCFMAVAAHGNREEGLGQSLESESRSTLLTAADFLVPGADPPSRLSFAVCHGLRPVNDNPHEPVGLAICALSAGAREILSTTLEIDFGTTLPSEILGELYRSIAAGERMSTALSRIQRALPDRLDQPLVRWAVLAVIDAA